jgi:hypothetical protein
MTLSAFETSVQQMPTLKKRLASGQMFNAYEIGDGWCVCLGPISDTMWITGPVPHTVANLLVDALRIAASQPEQPCRAFPEEGVA